MVLPGVHQISQRTIARISAELGSCELLIASAFCSQMSIRTSAGNVQEIRLETRMLQAKPKSWRCSEYAVTAFALHSGLTWARSGHTNILLQSQALQPFPAVHDNSSALLPDYFFWSTFRGTFSGRSEETLHGCYLIAQSVDSSTV